MSVSFSSSACATSVGSTTPARQPAVNRKSIPSKERDGELSSIQIAGGDDRQADDYGRLLLPLSQQDGVHARDRQRQCCVRTKSTPLPVSAIKPGINEEDCVVSRHSFVASVISLLLPMPAPKTLRHQRRKSRGFKHRRRRTMSMLKTLSVAA